MVDVRGGVATVLNPYEPLFAATAIEVTPLWSSTGPNEGSDTWGELSGMVVGRGVVFLIDSSLNRVHRVGLNGTQHPSIGRMGQGPGEFEHLTTVAPLGEGFASLDLNSRVLLFDRDGQYLRLLAMGDIGEMLPLGEDRLLLLGILGGRWSSLGLDGSPAPIELPPLPPLEGDTEPGCARFVPWGSGIGRLRCAVPHLDIFDSGGSPLRRIVLPGEVERNSATRQTARQARMGAAYSRIMSEAGMSGASISNVLARVSANPPELVDKYRGASFDGVAGMAAVWEQAPEEAEPTTCSLHLMTAEGHYLTTIQFDETWVDMELVDGVLLTLSSDSEGRSEIQARRLALPPYDLTATRTPAAGTLPH